jgi:amidase
MYLSRREFVQYAAVTGLAAPLSARGLAAEPSPAGGNPPRPFTPSFELEEITIQQLQDGLKSGKYTSRRLVAAYLTRIQQIDGAGPTLRSVIETNPDALALADAADAERKAGKVRGPLHGIPVLIKDNIATGDKMKTTAGSLALADAPAPRDSAVAKRLRDAGAIIIGKTNLSEWANFRSTHSVSGWSGRGGLVKNPYALDRNACGSSSGTGAGRRWTFPPSRSMSRSPGRSRRPRRRISRRSRVSSAG